MNKIFVTGDCHARFEKFSSDNFPIGKELDKNDYVIILGDVGILWDKELSKNEKYWIDWLENKPWTTLFILGNHDNYNRWEQIPKELWHGGYVQKLAPSVIRLCYGEIFDIAGKTFLGLSGARSHDIQHGIIDPADYATREEMNRACRKLEKKHGGWQFTMYRIKGESWWPQEVPTTEERLYLLNNLEKCNKKVDYVLSHEAPASCVALLGGGYYKPDEYSVFLEELRGSIDYGKWCFAHYHVDRPAGYKEICYYENITRIE